MTVVMGRRIHKLCDCQWTLEQMGKAGGLQERWVAIDDLLGALDRHIVFDLPSRDVRVG